MDDYVVEIDDIIITIDDDIISDGDSSDFMKTLFQKDQNLKIELSKALKHASYRFKNFKWDVIIAIRLPIGKSKDNVIFSLAVSFGMERYKLCCFKNKSYENKYFVMNKKELNLSNIDKIEKKFYQYLNYNDLYIKESLFIRDNDIKGFLRDTHNKNIEVFNYVDKIFDYKYSNILNARVIEYLIGESFFVDDAFDKLLSKENLSCKSALKYLFAIGTFSNNLTKAEFESMLESDDIEGIAENIKLLIY